MVYTQTSHRNREFQAAHALTFRSIVVMMPIPTPEGRVRDGRIARRRGVQADHAVEVIADDAVEQRRWCRRCRGRGWVVVGHRGKACDDLRLVLDRMVSPVGMIRGSTPIGSWRRWSEAKMARGSAPPSVQIHPTYLHIIYSPKWAKKARRRWLASRRSLRRRMSQKHRTEQDKRKYSPGSM